MKLSKAVYLGCYVVGIPLSGALNIYALSLEKERSGSGLALMIPAYIIMFIVMFLWFHLYYRAWKSIQDGYTKPKAGTAVGLLLIPLFHFYWSFVAIWGLAKEYNAFIVRHAIPVRRLPAGLFLAYVITLLFWLIPGVNALAAAATIVLNIPIIWKICDAVNALPETAAQAPALGTPPVFPGTP
jgi:hypothetical protein